MPEVKRKWNTSTAKFFPHLFLYIFLKKGLKRVPPHCTFMCHSNILMCAAYACFPHEPIALAFIRSVFVVEGGSACEVTLRH